MKSAIEINNLYKRYIIRHQKREQYTALRDVITEKAINLFKSISRHNKKSPQVIKKEEFWALKDISFEVKAGEKIAIIGRNGAGKTTLLKVLSRITDPTRGMIKVRGRVASLLEVGTGFHPELTGRENIFLNGAVLGMSRAEIRKRFDEIVAFAEIEKFLDTPVKRFSSGMHVRLTFAIAAHLEPEILLIDEILAVGDAAFQKKCLGKMGDAAKEGRTILFVSHNMAAVQSLCDKAVLLDHGNVIKTGEMKEVVDYYLKSMTKSSHIQSWSDPKLAPGDDSIRVNHIQVSSEENTSTKLITVNTPIKIDIDYWNLKHNTYLIVYLIIYNLEGTCVFATTTIEEPKWHGKEFKIGLYRSTCHIPANLLNDGTYRVKIVFGKDVSNLFFRMEDAIMFDIHEMERETTWISKWPGAVRPYLKWNTELIKDGIK